MITLPIKKKWLDMIISGEKKEEYRERKPYYTSRFRTLWEHAGIYGTQTPRQIKLRAGYRSDSPTITVTVTLRIGEGRPEWGAEPNKKYYILDILDYEEEESDDNQKNHRD